MRQSFLAWAVLLICGATQVAAQENKVVVELFTSQGCSSCPPADALLADLARRDDVIALALHVDYWDYLGWKDNFGKAAFTRRQHSYATAAHATMVYTPQIIVGGRDHVVGSKAMDVMDLIAAHRAAQLPVGLQLQKIDDDLVITATSRAGRLGDMSVQLVRYMPMQTVDIQRGENAGRSISYANIVTAWDVIATWDGAAPLRIGAELEGTEPAVVIIQQAGHGPIFASAELR